MFARLNLQNFKLLLLFIIYNFNCDYLTYTNFFIFLIYVHITHAYPRFIFLIFNNKGLINTI